MFCQIQLKLFNLIKNMSIVKVMLCYVKFDATCESRFEIMLHQKLCHDLGLHPSNAMCTIIINQV